MVFQSVSNFVNLLSCGSILILVHGENESKFITILRTFDLRYEYGPCVGVSRLERWERAKAMGLNPPQEVPPS
jgi:DNA polymerase delta subunit 4